MNSGDSPLALGKLVSSQKIAYGNGNLKEERKELSEIGLQWSVAARTGWDTMYDTQCADPDNSWDGTVSRLHD
jgi:outer membrane receptor for ferrienterochelin and colicin